MVTQKMSNSKSPETDHVETIPDGAGCTEIWEHLSDEREKTQQ